MKKPLKQEPGSSNCVAIVAAMAAGTTVEEFERFIGYDEDYDGPYGNLDLFKFMLHKGYCAGIGIRFSTDDIKGHTIDGERLQADFSIYDYPAYVVVESRNWEGKTHAVYWDGRRILDPDPNIEIGLTLKEYKVIFWLPIYKIDENAGSSGDRDR